MLKVIGVIEWRDGAGQKLKVVSNHNGRVIRHTMTRPNGKISHKEVIDIAARHAKVRTSEVKLPNHIRQGIEEKE